MAKHYTPLPTRVTKENIVETIEALRAATPEIQAVDTDRKNGTQSLVRRSKSVYRTASAVLEVARMHGLPLTISEDAEFVLHSAAGTAARQLSTYAETPATAREYAACWLEHAVLAQNVPGTSPKLLRPTTREVALAAWATYNADAEVVSGQYQHQKRRHYGALIKAGAMCLENSLVLADTVPASSRSERAKDHLLAGHIARSLARHPMSEVVETQTGLKPEALQVIAQKHYTAAKRLAPLTTTTRRNAALLLRDVA